MGRLGRLPLRPAAGNGGGPAGLAGPFMEPGGRRRVAGGAVAERSRAARTAVPRAPSRMPGTPTSTGNGASRAASATTRGRKRRRARWFAGPFMERGLRALGAGRHDRGRGGTPPRLQPADPPGHRVARMPWRVGVRARIHPGLGVQPALPHPGGGADDARHRPARRTVRYRVADRVPLDHPASGVLWIAQRVLRRAFTGIGI